MNHPQHIPREDPAVEAIAWFTMLARGRHTRNFKLIREANAGLDAQAHRAGQPEGAGGGRELCTGRQLIADRRRHSGIQHQRRLQRDLAGCR